MRAYFFGNYYLSQIQQGIQALHCAVDMSTQYQFLSSAAARIYFAWARDHKTVVLLNGGNQQSLQDLFNFLDTSENPYPIGQFKEDNQSLNDCLTCVGIVLPEPIYEGAAFLRTRGSMVIDIGDEFQLGTTHGLSFNEDYFYTAWEVELMKKLNEYRLA